MVHIETQTQHADVLAPTLALCKCCKWMTAHHVLRSYLVRRINGLPMCIVERQCEYTCARCQARTLGREPPNVAPPFVLHRLGFVVFGIVPVLVGLTVGILGRQGGKW